MKHPLLSLCLAMSVSLPTSSCGALFYSERQNVEHSGKLDPNILVLDGIGLLFFVIPGLVAFGVDFYTGTAYLPEGVEKGEGPFIRDAKKGEDGAKEDSEKDTE